MGTLVVVDRLKDWPINMHSIDPSVELISAKDYLSERRYTTRRRLKVFNLCRSYRYQSMGYYVSLLAEARGHRPLPNVSAIQDMKSQTLLRLTSEDIDDVLQKSLSPLKSTTFDLSIYFGRNVAKRYDRLALQIFNLFQAPMLRARFICADHTSRWQLQSVRPISSSEIPTEHYDFVLEAARDYFHRHRFRPIKTKLPRYDMAILVGPDDTTAPSDSKALKRFVRAAQAADLQVEIIDKTSYARLAEFDALFIRETTAVNHHTYRFARRAAAEGLVVIDDPQSIVRCTNKVYLAELMERHKIPIPKTMIVTRDNVQMIAKTLGLPCVLKQPDSSFSQGVVRADTIEQLERTAERFLDKSDMVVAQEYAPTTFDWRVGIIDRQPLFVCKYHMAAQHWQVVKKNANGKASEGGSETMALSDVPPDLIQLALNSANPIGDGLYGVDIKQFEDRYSVIEVNDNPSIESGVEDQILKDELYERIINVFVRRLDARTEGKAARESTEHRG